MSEPAPYRVVYSERVKLRLLALADQAIERGDGETFLVALKEFHRRLCLYPQFGDPLTNLNQGQVWNAIIRPLAMRYALYEDRRLVMVTALPVLLPKSEPGASLEQSDHDKQAVQPAPTVNNSQAARR